MTVLRTARHEGRVWEVHSGSVFVGYRKLVAGEEVSATKKEYDQWVTLSFARQGYTDHAARILRDPGNYPSDYVGEARVLCAQSRHSEYRGAALSGGLPEWAQKNREVVRFAEADIGFWVECWSDLAQKSGREQERLMGVAHRVLDYRQDLC